MRGLVERFGRGDPLHARGVAITLFTALMWSSTGLIFRHIEQATPWQVIFFRAMLLGGALALAFGLRYRRRTLAAVASIGLTGLIAAVLLSLGSVFFLFAISRTTIANVAFLTSSVPFLAAIAGWLLLRERVARTTGVCIAFAMLGVAVMVAEGFALGGWVGNLMALGCASASAGFTIALRYGRHGDMSPCVMVSGFVTMVIAAPFVGAFTITWHDLAMCAIQGVAVSALCNVLFTYAARWVPAAELTLLSLLETVLSPTWVWLALNEVPSPWTLLGGAIVLGAVMGQAVGALRRGAVGR
ncbi:MAG: DMT family transporter [Alphaproteobacteria bacterium]